MHLFLGVGSILLGSTMTFAFGQWTETLTLLSVLIAIDYITGVTAAIRDGSGLDSKVGFWGLFKKGLILLVVLLAHRVDVLLGTEMVMGGAVYFYIVNELLSVIENFGRIGVPLPPSLRKVIQILRDRVGKE
ncbi:phage holin family protein [Cohnella kolymensis]|uniref:phage holin family protein n=1 Tax=Cohnella kolymensis TaxID=1590652 RepID=UPI000698C9B2|nr:phage holin family protein [Cohnella kolymensis]